MKTYTPDGGSYTYNYTVFIPFGEIKEDPINFEYFGWTFFNDDSGHVMDYKFGRSYIGKPDPDEDDDAVMIGEIYKELGKYIPQKYKEKMIKDLFTQ